MIRYEPRPERTNEHLQYSFDRSSEKKPLQVNVTLDSVSKLFAGRIKDIVPEADPRSRTFPVIIEIDNQKTTRGFVLKAGMLAKASLAIGRIQPVKVVSKDALVIGDRKVEVFVVGENSRVRAVTVKTGGADGDDIEVIGDLKKGDRVVTHGNERLRNGQEVKVLN